MSIKLNYRSDVAVWDSQQLCFGRMIASKGRRRYFVVGSGHVRVGCTPRNLCHRTICAV